MSRFDFSAVLLLSLSKSALYLAMFSEPIDANYTSQPRRLHKSTEFPR
jgi:hypothetical protein